MAAGASSVGEGDGSSGGAVDPPSVAVVSTAELLVAAVVGVGASLVVGGAALVVGGLGRRFDRGLRLPLALVGGVRLGGVVHGHGGLRLHGRVAGIERDDVLGRELLPGR